MSTFAQLVASRKSWIEAELKPWCRAATEEDLKKAELEWTDIAGKVDPQVSLWAWAWSRFPGLVHEELNKIDETHQVTVTLKNGRIITGYPDSRQSRRHELVLCCQSVSPPRRFQDEGPFSLREIDHIAVHTHGTAADDEVAGSDIPRSPN